MTIELDGASLQEGVMDGLTLLEVYVGAKKIWPTEEVYQVSITDVRGYGAVHPLVSVTVPAGQVWDVQIEGTVTKASPNTTTQPQFRIGTSTSGSHAEGASVNFSGTVSSANATIAIVNRDSFVSTSFTGTVTIRK